MSQSLADEDLRAAMFSGAGVGEVLACLDAGADPNQRFIHGSTPILEAETFEVASLLLDRGAEVHAEDDYGRGVFHVLGYTQMPYELARLYQWTRADLEGRDCDGRTPLLHCLTIPQGHVSAPHALLLIYANAHAIDAQGNNALHCWAMGRARVEIGERLLSLGVDPCALNRLGQSVADLLADNHHEGSGYELIRSIVEHEVLAESTAPVLRSAAPRRV